MEKMSENSENSPFLSEDATPLVFAEFNDAYSFRILVEYLNLTNDNGNFIFTPKNIYYFRGNDSNQVFNEVLIHTHELTHYEYNHDEAEVVAGVNLTQFKNAIKKIGKKDIARLMVFDGQVCLKIIGSPKNYSENDVEIVRTQHLDRAVFDGDGYQDETEPNCTVSIQKFTSACSDLAGCKDEYIKVIGLDHGVIFEARQGGNLRANIRYCGHFEDFTVRPSQKAKSKLRINFQYHDQIVTYKIHRRIVSALSKLTNISPNGTVKIYIQPSPLPIKLLLHLSTYGDVAIYLQGSE